MDFTCPDIAIQAEPSSLQKTGNALRKVFVSDPGPAVQLFLAFSVIAGGIVLHMNAIQWVLVSFVTLLFLIAGIFRTAALLQINHDPTLSPFHASRIRCMGNILVTVTAGLSLLTYLLVFVPKIGQLMI